MTEESLVIAATDHDLGEWIEEVPASSTGDGMAGHYQCSHCHKYFDADKNEVDGDSLVIPGYEVSYDYSNPVWTWERDGDDKLTGNATVTFNETHGEDPLVLEASVVKYNRSDATCESAAIKYYIADTSEYGNVPYKSDMSEDFEEGDPLGHTYGDLVAEVPATCEEGGMAAYYECSVCHKVFDENKVETTLEALAVSALGHSYGEWIEEVPATCEETGMAAHYHCEACGKYFDENKDEVTKDSLIIPAIGPMGEPTLLTSDNASADMVGKKVYLMTDDHGVGVALGQTNNMSTDQSLFTEFTITEVSGSAMSDLKVTIVSPDGYYLTKAYGTIAFTNTNAQSIIVGVTGGLNAGSDFNAYLILYDEGRIQLADMFSFESDNIQMFLLGAPGHDYGTLIPSTATCEEGGVAAHYECSVCHKVFDENKVETTLEALAVSALGHAYGDLIEEDHDGNGLAAHYECSVCHKLFDENKTETTAEALALGGSSSQACEISLDEGAICINPNGYARSESGLSNPTPFVSSATNPYLIKNQEINWCDNIIQVYQNDSGIETADIYIKLSNVTIEADDYCSLFLIKATRTINIHLIIEGTVTFVGGWDQQVFSSQGSGSPTVNIIIDQTTAGGTFNAQAEDGLTYAQSGTINVSYV